MSTIALTGFDGEPARSLASVAIHVDTRNYGLVEDAHQACMHLLAQYVRQSRMTPRPGRGPCLLSRMRVAINLLTDDPAHPSGAHWFWTRMIPEMAKLARGRRGAPPHGEPEVAGGAPGLRAGSPLHHLPMVERAPAAAHAERAALRPAAAARRQDRRVQHADRAARATRARAVVAHIKTMHAFTAPTAVSPLVARVPAAEPTRTPPRSRTRSSSTPRACAPRCSPTSTSIPTSCA